MSQPAEKKVTRRRYTTGNAELDKKVAELVEASGVTEPREAELVNQIVMTGLLLARDEASRLDLRIINAALKEMRYAFKVFAPYRETKKVSVFGSARTSDGHPDYEYAREFGRRIAERGWMVVTGAGPGTMAAANEGAGAAKSFGVNIRLPFEAEPNPFIAEDPKLINFKYFFTRKLMFVKEAQAFVLLPGGFGTLDEAFELLTLTQTGKSDVHPIVLLDTPSGRFWRRWLTFVEDALIPNGYISEQDLSLVKMTDDVDEAVEELERFYRNFHSMRFVGDKLFIRMRKAPDGERLRELSAEFADLLVSGDIERASPTKAELRDEDALDQERLCLFFDRASYGRLRQLIDRLNET